MGVISKIFWVVVPGVAGLSYVALSLGAQLPVATRSAGRKVGMSYNYLKVVINHLTPRSNQGIELVRKLRQSGQQAFAFSNEVKWNLMETKPLVKQAFPGISEDPFKKFGLQEEVPSKKPTQSATDLVFEAFSEKKRIEHKKQQKAKEEQDIQSLIK